MTAQQQNPFAFGKPITLDTLDELFAHHRGLTGGWRMDAGNDDGNDSGEDGGGDNGFQPITSQADLDRIIGTRLARERDKFADYDEVKEKASKYDQGIEDAKDEQQKAVDAARREGETAALERANTVLVNAEARALAAEARFRNPQLAVRAIDLASVKVADDGTVDVDAIKAKLKELSDAEPYLVDDGKRTLRPDRSQGGDSGGDDKPSVQRGRDLYEGRRTKKSA